MLLSKDKILAADDLKYEDVEVPEWGGTVRVRTMTGTERDAFEESMVDKDKKTTFKNVRAKLTSKTVVDENNNPMFSDADIEKLGKKSARALDRIFAVAQRLNGIGKEDIEEYTKN